MDSYSIRNQLNSTKGNCIRIFTIFFAIACTLLTLSGSVFCEEKQTAVEAQTHEIANSILSPFCPGRTLNDCPSSQATELRNKISAMLNEGKTSDEVMNNLFTLYGEEIRAAPKKEGFGLLAWIMPFVFLVVGLLVLIAWLSLRSSKSQTSALPVLDANIAARIQKELE